MIACDKDDEAINFSKNRLSEFGDRVKIYKTNFANLLKILSPDELKNVRAILADIGLSSLQIDKNERGFSLNSDYLDMRMDTSAKLNAYEVVNHYGKDELARIFYEYGEIKQAKFLAEKIINARLQTPIKSAKQLSQIIGTKSVNQRSISLATLAFQAIRIEVNHELDELKNLLEGIENSGIKDCLVCIISFHSLEDRIVKNTFKKWANPCICPPQILRCQCGACNAKGEIITKKPIVASDDEIKQNSRSKCAKMRIFRIEK